MQGGPVGAEPQGFTVWRRRARLVPPAREEGCMIPLTVCWHFLYHRRDFYCRNPNVLRKRSSREG